jgi:putative toxin-antitoxin system antitoxin component (TIGR02293 family)
MHASSALRYLGGRQVFGRHAHSTLEINDLIQAGFPARALAAFKERAQLSNREVARALGVSEKTVERVGTQAHIKPATSDRLYRMARIVELATEVLCDEQQALEWLRTPQHGLAERVPLDLLATDAGTEQIRAELLRIRFGFLA